VVRELLGSSNRRRLVLGFDAGCMACGDLARRIEERVGDKIEVRSLRDPLVEHWRKQVLGEDAPWVPILIEVEGGKVRAWTGLQMGVALSRKLGLLETWQVMQVLGEYNAAHRVAESRTAQAAAGMSRRQFLKGLAGGLVAISILPAGEALAASQKATGVSDVTQVSENSATVSRLKRFRAVRTAGGRFGRPDWSGVAKANYEDNGEQRALFVIPYGSTTAAAGTTFLIAEDEDSLEDAHSVVLQVRQSGREQAELDYYLTDGTPLATVQVSEDGKVEARPAGEQSSQQQIPPGFFRCFFACVGANLGPDCGASCFFCVVSRSLPACARCVICAGMVGVRCARLCS
jgi:hypothetical protein